MNNSGAQKSEQTFNVVVVGTGYVGLTTGATLAFLGHNVTCIDIDHAKIDALKQGHVPFHEPHIKELMDAGAKRLQFSTKLDEAVSKADISFITVGTPPLPDGRADLSAVAAVAKGIGHALHNGQRHIIINKSTVPIGSANYVESLVREGYREHNDPTSQGAFEVASNPEFLREGSAVHDSLYPDRIVLGADQNETLETLGRLYHPQLEQSFTAPSFAPRPKNFKAVPLITTDITSAETIKYAANAFLASKISFINEMSGLCERVGADVSEVAKGIGLDSRIGPKFLQAGIGWGGSCFGKDTQALINSGKEYGYTMPMLEASICINKRQRMVVIEKLQQELKVLKGRRIGLLGLSFKENTDDLRDSPTLELIDALLQRGAHVCVHDPVAMPAHQKLYPDVPIHYANTVNDLAFEADALVLVTPWTQYRDLNWAELAAQMQRPLVIDSRNHLNQKSLLAHNIHYVGIGR